MIRKRRHSVGTDRWMVSWADLLTLLFASIVVLYASAARSGFPAVNSTKLSKPANLTELLAGRPESMQPKPVQPQSARPQPDELASSFDRLRESLGDEIGAGKLQVSMETRGIVVSLRDQSYFKSGSDEIAPVALNSIGEVASVIRELPNSVRLEGHTDSVPIHNEKFRDNWSLSAARSAAVLGLLESRFGIPAGRLAIAAYADNQPVAANESAEGRARNRRVDIVILSQKNI
jgi:chemotaxis protein MotB